MSAELNDSIVQVPVPARFLSVVYQALAQAIAEEGSAQVLQAPSATSAATAANEPKVDWSKVENMRRLRQVLFAPTVIRLLDRAAAQPGTYILLAEAGQEAGRSANHQRADMATLTKAIRREFKVVPNWPFTQWQFDDQGRVMYALASEVAAAWIASGGNKP